MEKTALKLKSILNPIEENLWEFNPKLLENFASDNILIDKIAKYILESGGKKLRPSLVFLFAKMIGEINPQHYNLACAVELIHSATLVHDDIIHSPLKDFLGLFCSQ
jgi:octaprenyl-diphosphate synthase